ncbi:MAG TPA: 16S rRNA (guanine(966)-N(2))-methyltransferase RsmD [Limnochordia bacterium]|nr:16S rRNA (guanine(966)-N(2))-methyltransferase RsmD [Limnochordia bacterium]
MRVIAGKAKGTKLASVKGLSTRPTGDRVKEALFNILGPAVVESSFLDLFAGSGAIGLEALSRGARQVVWVEADRACCEQIKKNLARTGLQGGVVYRSDVFAALNGLHKRGEQFDLIFLDPPYNRGLVAKTLERLTATELLTPEGIIIAEASKKEEAPLGVSKLCLEQIRTYGETALLFYRWEGSQ